MTSNHTDKLDFTLQWADTSLIMGHRLSEWCGHGPILEQDIAMSNIALDFVGEARSLYQYAAALEGAGKSEDDLAYFRDDLQFRNALLAELPNGDFAQTVLRLFLYEAFHMPWLEKMLENQDETFAGVAGKSVKEARYHFKWSAEWVIRLGDGTEESKQRIQSALEDIWPYTGELMMPASHEQALIKAGQLPSLAPVKEIWFKHVADVFAQATLEMPDPDVWMHTGGKMCKHTEHLGYLLAEMQVVQRAYPGNEW